MDTETSFSLHAQDEWRTNYYYSLRKMDTMPLLLPAGASRMIRDMVYELDRLRAGPSALHMPYSNPDNVTEEVEQARYLEALRWRYHELLHSLSSRMTLPFRMLVGMLTGWGTPPAPPRLWQLTARDLEYLIDQIEGSRSWKMTAVLRSLRQRKA